MPAALSSSLAAFSVALALQQRPQSPLHKSSREKHQEVSCSWGLAALAREGVQPCRDVSLRMERSSCSLCHLECCVRVCEGTFLGLVSHRTDGDKLLANRCGVPGHGEWLPAQLPCPLPRIFPCLSFGPSASNADPSSDGFALPLAALLSLPGMTKAVLVSLQLSFPLISFPSPAHVSFLPRPRAGWKP